MSETQVLIINDSFQFFWDFIPGIIFWRGASEYSEKLTYQQQG